MDHRISIGSIAKDMITGFEGMVTGVAEYIGGDRSYLIEAQYSDKEDSRWIRSYRVETVETAECPPAE
jgi:hypothetical protein